MSKDLSDRIRNLLTEEEFKQDQKLTKSLERVPTHKHPNGTLDHMKTAIHVVRIVGAHYSGLDASAKAKRHYSETGEVHLPKHEHFDALVHHNNGEHGKLIDDKAFDGYPGDEKYNDETDKFEHVAVKLTPNARALGRKMSS